MISGWILLGLVGAVSMAAGSRLALREVIALSERLGVSKFVVGLTLVAFGTDLPEIVNSIVSSALGHGDINLGDSIGSVLTQSTLVLGMLPLVAVRSSPIRSADTVFLGASTIGLLALGIVLVRDGMVSRADGALLVVGGLAAVGAAVSRRALADQTALARVDGSALRQGARALAALLGVGIGAGALVASIVEISALLGMPEYALSFFAASLGTSLPEFVVNLMAMRRGQREVALGGMLGACLLDASVSAGVGPMMFPTVVTASAAVRGAVVAAAAMALASLAIGFRGRHDRVTGAILVLAYFFAYALLLGPV